MQVTGCALYVADRYVGWQEATLNFLASQFDSKTRSFPATWVKEVTEAVKVSGKAGDMSDKALKQTVIPFAKVKADEAQKGGAQVRTLWHNLLLKLARSGVTFQTAGDTAGPVHKIGPADICLESLHMLCWGTFIFGRMCDVRSMLANDRFNRYWLYTSLPSW